MTEENPKPPSDEGFHRREGKQNPKPPSDEGFHRRGGKQKPKPPSDEGFHRREGKENPKPPSDEWFHLCGGKQKPKPPSDEGGGPKGRRERKQFEDSKCFRKTRNFLSPSQLRCQPPRQRGPRRRSQFPEKTEQSLPQSTPLTLSSSEGAEGAALSVGFAASSPKGRAKTFVNPSPRRTPHLFTILYYPLSIIYSSPSSRRASSRAAAMVWSMSQ